ncbi:hypothetical protein RHS01_07323 [Rhizoctonia solani]|uniref:Uncharacterized protein n=1 Tax=Rhizoctonia solani TaxID=456999 RepID=A0A8H7IAC2_9AGAM|nr:hypothetical protein RHS01_07323 [Rhizoctonia solani]
MADLILAPDIRYSDPRTLCVYTLTLLLTDSDLSPKRGPTPPKYPNDFSQLSSRKGGVIDEDVLKETMAVVNNLRVEFNRQEREKEAGQGWTHWFLSPFSITRDALVVSSTHAYPSCPTRLDERYTSALYSKRTFIAINLLQNEELMPTLTRELDRSHSSVGTGPDALGTPYKVIAKGLMEPQQKEHGHRISRLSSVRNAAMEPLQDLDPLEFDNVLWLNDIFHCHTDVLELLLQKQKQGAVQACGLDFGPKGLIYDRWVLRNMRGRPFYNYSDIVDFFSSDITYKTRPMVLPLAEDSEDKSALERGNPFQVFSCWNGVTALSAEQQIEWLIPWTYTNRIEYLQRTVNLQTTPQIKWQTTPPDTVYMNNFAVWYLPETPEPWDEA